jgi:hypothetical protein
MHQRLKTLDLESLSNRIVERRTFVL